MDYTVREDVGSAAVVVTLSSGVLNSAVVISVISSDEQATGNQTLLSKIVFDLIYDVLTYTITVLRGRIHNYLHSFLSS